jgi:glucose-like phosphotransferase system IIB component
LFQIAVGTTFSCGLIDLTLYGILQGNAKTNWLMFLPIFAAYFVIYYFLFKFVIKKWNLQTPGREPDEQESKLYTKADYVAKQESAKSTDGAKEEKAAKAAAKDEAMAKIVEGLGGKANIESLDACATRLRLNVVDPAKVNKDLLKTTGALGVMVKGNGVQVIYGPQVSTIKPKLEEYLSGI